MTEQYRRKSDLIIEAERLRYLNMPKAARELYSEAAMIECEIAQTIRGEGDAEYYINAISAASCWLMAGSHVAAQRVLLELLAGPLPPPIRTEVERHLAATERAQRARCWTPDLRPRREETAVCSQPGSDEGASAPDMAPRWRANRSLREAFALAV